MSALRVLVVGAGAIGSVFGGLLSARGHAVTLVGRAAHMQATRENGLRVSGLFGDVLSHPETATALPTERSDFDFAFVATKSHATAETARELARRIAPTTTVVSLQNGLGNVETISEHVGEERVLGASIIFGALIERPGHAHVTVCAQPVDIGPAIPNPALLSVAEHLTRQIDETGIPCRPCADMRPLLWEKVLYNCGLNPLGALHGLTYGEVASSTELRPLLDAAIIEAFDVARASGVDLRWPTAQDYVRHFHEKLLPPTSAHRSSMRQDLEAGRRTEVDAIGGAVARRGRAAGISTPVNDRLSAAIRKAERRA